MILNKEQDIEFLKECANKLFASVLSMEYGTTGLSHLTEITGIATKIYHYIPLDRSYNILIFKTITSETRLSSLCISAPTQVSDFSALAAYTSRTMIIEVISNQEVNICFDEVIDPKSISADCIVYHFEKGDEKVFKKMETINLPKPPDVISYYACPTFKNLEAALDLYKIKRARRSNCTILSTAWFDGTNRILFRKGPEHILRRSLYDFLSHYVRGEVKEEQNVDDSKPVDIKITFDFSSHIAIIEIKWMGKSIEFLGQSKPNQNMSEFHARAGSHQLADYLERHKPYSNAKYTKGYLVVFDGRRKLSNTSSTLINQSNGMYYENKEVEYLFKYDVTRRDFAKPIRFFIEPIYN